MNIIIKDGLSLAFFCISVRIIPCIVLFFIVGGYFICSPFLLISHFQSRVLDLKQSNDASDMWVVKLFVLLLMMGIQV